MRPGETNVKKKTFPFHKKKGDQVIQVVTFLGWWKRDPFKGFSVTSN